MFAIESQQIIHPSYSRDSHMQSVHLAFLRHEGMCENRVREHFNFGGRRQDGNRTCHFKPFGGGLSRPEADFINHKLAGYQPVPGSLNLQPEAGLFLRIN